MATERERHKLGCVASVGNIYLQVEARSIPLQEAIALHVEDVGHLEAGSSHGFFYGGPAGYCGTPTSP
jgi:hypothetical protein